MLSQQQKFDLQNIFKRKKRAPSRQKESFPTFSNSEDHQTIVSAITVKQEFMNSPGHDNNEENNGDSSENVRENFFKRFNDHSNFVRNNQNQLQNENQSSAIMIASAQNAYETCLLNDHVNLYEKRDEQLLKNSQKMFKTQPSTKQQQAEDGHYKSEQKFELRPSSAFKSRGSSSNRYSSYRHNDEKENDDYDQHFHQSNEKGTGAFNIVTSGSLEDSRNTFCQKRSDYTQSQVSQNSGVSSNSSRKFVISYNKANKKSALQVVDYQNTFTPNAKSGVHNHQASVYSDNNIHKTTNFSQSKGKQSARSKQSTTTVNKMVNQQHVQDFWKYPQQNIISNLLQIPDGTAFNRNDQIVDYTDSNQGYVNNNNYTGSFVTQTNAVCIDDTPCFQSAIGASIRSSISNIKPKMLTDDFNCNTQPISPVHEQIQVETNESEGGEDDLKTEDSCSGQSLTTERDNLNASIQTLIQNMEKIPKGKVHEAEELILRLHSLVQGDQEIPVDMKQQLSNFNNKILSLINDIKKTEQPNAGQYNSNRKNNQDVTPKKGMGFPVFMKDQSEEIINEYTCLSENYERFLTKITIKKLQKFTQLQQPHQLDLNVGLAFLLLFSNVDPSEIKLTIDKKRLLDRKWDNSVIKYFKNQGRVVQNLKKIKDILEQCQLTQIHYDQIKEYIMYEKIQDKDLDKIDEVTFEMLLFLRSIVEYYEFIRRVKQIPFVYKQQVNTVSSPRNRNFVTFQSPQKSEQSQQRIKRAKSIGVIKEPLIVQPQYDKLKFHLNNKIYEESLQFEKNALQQKEEMYEAKKLLQKLKSKEGQLTWDMERKRKSKIKQLTKEQEVEYMKYQQEMRKRFIEFIKEKMIKDKKDLLQQRHEQILDIRVQKMREYAQCKLELIEEFQKTVEQYYWNQHLKEQEKEFQKTMTQIFFESIKDEKFFQQQVYAAQRIAEHEERIRLKKIDLAYENYKILKEQEEVLHNLDLLTRFKD